MSVKNWSPVSRAQHWLTAILVVVCVGAVWGHEAFDRSNPLRGQLMQLHFLMGGTLGLLTVLRLVSRLLLKAPEHKMSAGMAMAAKVGHMALYGLLFALPVAGYIMVSGKGAPIDLLGLITVQPLPVSKETAGTFKEIHEVLGNALVAMVGLHVAAAVYHAVVLKDKVLQSMVGRA